LKRKPSVAYTSLHGARPPNIVLLKTPDLKLQPRKAYGPDTTYLFMFSLTPVVMSRGVMGGLQHAEAESVGICRPDVRETNMPTRERDEGGKPAER
jgi:hypothetical protein